MKRILILLPILALVAGLALVFIPGATAVSLGWLGLGSESAGPKLRTTVVDRGAITAAVAATGTVTPRVTVSVGSQLSGQIKELAADFNTRVAPGQAIARLDTQQLEARRAAAAADLEAAGAAVLVAAATAERVAAEAQQAAAQVRAMAASRDATAAQLRDAEYEANRTSELRRSGTGTSRDAVRAGFGLDRSRADLAQADAEYARTQAAETAAQAAARTAAAQVIAAEAARTQRAAQLRQVDVDLGFTTIRSPIEGVVISRNVDLGQTVAASFQAPVLFTIAASLDEMEVHATVDEADIGRIREGQEVPFSVAAFAGETINGRVKEIRLAASTVSNVVTYTVVITVPNASGRLLPGMTATLRIVTEQRADALRVPNAALRWRPPGGAEAARPGAGPGGGGGGGPLEQALRQMDDLTPGQRAEIEAAQAEFRNRVAELSASDPGRQQQVQSLRQRLLSRLNAVLTPDQRARLDASRAGRGSAGTVWVADPGAAPRAIPVRVGVTDGTFTEILGGSLTAGAAVVVGQERAPAPPPAAPPGRRPF